MSVPLAKLLGVAWSSGYRIPDSALQLIQAHAQDLGDVRRMIEKLATLPADATDDDVEDAVVMSVAPQREPEETPPPASAPSGPPRSGAGRSASQPSDPLADLLARAVGGSINY